MRYIDVEKKRTTIWPWIVGALVLAFLIWGTGTLLAPDEPSEPAANGPSIPADNLPTAIPQPPGETPPSERSDAAASPRDGPVAPTGPGGAEAGEGGPGTDDSGARAGPSGAGSDGP